MKGRGQPREGEVDRLYRQPARLDEARVLQATNAKQASPHDASGGALEQPAARDRSLYHTRCPSAALGLHPVALLLALLQPAAPSASLPMQAPGHNEMAHTASACDTLC